jgi:hypothetical protein
MIPEGQTGEVVGVFFSCEMEGPASICECWTTMVWVLEFTVPRTTSLGQVRVHWEARKNT